MRMVTQMERLVIRLDARGAFGSGKTHGLARALNAIMAELEIGEDAFVITTENGLIDHLEHLSEVRAKGHLDPNAVEYTLKVEHHG